MHPAIEKVARAICESTAEQAGFDAESLWMEVSDGYQLDARAAIRSFIEYTRDNVSETQRAAWERDFQPWLDETIQDEFYLYRAMLTALLNEIEEDK